MKPNLGKSSPSAEGALSQEAAPHQAPAAGAPGKAVPGLASRAAMTPEQTRRTFRELRSYQIQMEVQNADLRRIQAALRESELRYQRITEAIVDFFYSVRVVNRRAGAAVHSPGCLALTGYRDDEFASDPQLWRHLVAADDLRAVDEQTRRVLAGDRPAPLEHRIICKNAMERWVRNTLVPRYNGRGKLVAYDGLIQDITLRKHAEEGMRASRDYLKTVLDATDDAILVEDPASGRILDVNLRMCEMYGCSYDEALGTRVGELSEGSPPYSRSDRMERLEQARTHGPQVFEWLCKRRHGEVFWAEICIRCVTLGTAERLVVSVRDIGERKQVEAALRQQYAELERFNKAAVGRELRMIALKQEINDLLEATGQTAKYRIVDGHE